MKKTLFLCLGLYFVLFFSLPRPSQAAEIDGLAPVKKTDRILILAPHPDDEAIGCAGIIQQAVHTGAALEVAYLTAGDHNQFAFIVYEKRIPLLKGDFLHMGKVRRKEAVKAMGLLGLAQEKLTFLGYPDFGTFSIFSRYWGDTGPYKSLLTRVSAVPYKGDLSFGAPYKGESILADLERVISRFRPNKIFVSHPADVNADHKALYLFLEVALSDLEKSLPRPLVYYYLIHRLNWPMPRRYHPELPLLPPEQFSDSAVSWFKFDLSGGQLGRKHEAILCYKSQTESSAFYLMSFARKNELFSDYPPVELKIQPSFQGAATDFTGASGMFADSDAAALNAPDKAAEEKEGEVSYGIKGDHLLVRIVKSGGRKRWPGMVVYLFGYSHKTPFAKMPKVRIITGNNLVKVFDGARRVKNTGVFFAQSGKSAVLSVPFAALGYPDFILTAIKAYRGLLPASATAFRKIAIRNN